MEQDKIVIKNYTKQIGKTTVLKDINLEILKGSSIWIKGENGSGKTMLLRAIAGLIIPDTGSVEIFGKRLGVKHRFPDSVGIIIENINFWGNMSAYQTLKTLASIKNIIGNDEINRALQRCGLDPKDKRPVRKYSLGMKQRLAIAQAIMEKPDILLLDEPLNALDDNGVLLLRNIIEEEHNRGATIVIASHISNDMIGLYDTEINIRSGEIQY